MTDPRTHTEAEVGALAINQNGEMREKLAAIDEAVVALSKTLIDDGVLPAGNYPGAVAMLGYLRERAREGTVLQGHIAALVEAAGREMAKAGWNACRRSVYAVCEDVQNEADRIDDGSKDTPQHHFLRGQRHTGKSIARGFNSMEAENDDNLIRALAAPTPALDAMLAAARAAERAELLSLMTAVAEGIGYLSVENMREVVEMRAAADGGKA